MGSNIYTMTTRREMESEEHQHDWAPLERDVNMACYPYKPQKEEKKKKTKKPPGNTITKN